MKKPIRRAPPVEPVEEEEKAFVEPVPVKLAIQPGEAAIYLNGKFWGISPTDGKIDNLRLKPGTYNLDVMKPGYISLKQVFLVKKETAVLSIKLNKK
ncbi:MAG: PEGA domain-containing protein [bacterium]|nr:PEGA domain-containing protein [bacterium]